MSNKMTLTKLIMLIVAYAIKRQVRKAGALNDGLKKTHIDFEEIIQATIKELERANEKLDEKSTARLRTPTALAEQKVRWVIKFIRDNYTADISREGLAAAVEMSPDHLSRMFNRINGMRIGEYVNQLRLEDAARRLRDSDASVIFIAMEVGYESLRHFNRVFNKIYGMTPSQYRSKTNKYYRTISVRTADGWTNPPLSRYL